VVDPYIDPGSGILRNVLGITNQVDLEAAECLITDARNVELKTNYLAGTYDFTHLQRFHHYLFQDIYSWAGQIRSVGLSKGGVTFCLPEHIDTTAQSIFANIATIESLPKDTAEAAQVLAEVLGDLNALHPFREGNGRAQRCFSWQFAALRGWNVNWSLLDPDANVAASKKAMLTDYAPLARLIEPLLEPML
jgi:cell filamentation protein